LRAFAERRMAVADAATALTREEALQASAERMDAVAADGDGGGRA
jgi:hypothetical protein